MNTEFVRGFCEQCLHHDSVRLELTDIAQHRWAICPAGHMQRIGVSELAKQMAPVYLEYTPDCAPELGDRMEVDGRQMEVTCLEYDSSFISHAVTAQLQPV